MPALSRAVTRERSAKSHPVIRWCMICCGTNYGADWVRSVKFMTSTSAIAVWPGVGFKMPERAQ